MIVLLLSGSPKIGSQPILEVLHELAPRGVDVKVAIWAPATQDLLDASRDVVVWGPKKVQEPVEHRITGSTDATDFSASTETEVEESDTAHRASQEVARGFGPERLKAAYRWRMLRLRKALRPYYGSVRARATAPLRRLYPWRAWRRVRRDEQVLAWAGAAEVIVAMDSQAVLAAWKLARRLASPDVVYGLSAGRGVILRRLAG